MSLIDRRVMVAALAMAQAAAADILWDQSDYDVWGMGFFNADAGLRVSLFAGLFSELKAEWRHDQTPAPDAERNDYRYLVNIGWAFQ